MKHDLIFDLGMHLGEDSDFYLKKGFEVVAVEANPDNVKYCEARFAQEISEGRLHIVSGAIVTNRKEGFVTFYQNVKSNWGTVEKDWANRNLGRGNPSVEIKVSIVDMQHLFSQYGIPYYIKIDLQGQELAVISLLKSLPNIPQYASLNLGVWDQIVFDKIDSTKLIRVLNSFTEVGYKKFKVVQQATIPGSRIITCDLNGAQFDYTFQRHSSGTFGNDIAGDWVSYRKAIELYLHQARSRGWLDVHATL